jgi:prephenate dehydrogenase
MGMLTARFLETDGFYVTIWGRKPEKTKRIAKKIDVYSASTIEKSVTNADIVIVSVPIENTYEVCKSAAKYMKKGAILVDISSVKTSIADKLQRKLPTQIKYVSIHPLFGPQIESLEGQNFVVIKGSEAASSRKIIGYLKEKGANAIFLSVKDHDRAMATFQALHHFAMLSFLYAFLKQISKIKEPSKLTTNSLRLTMKSIRRILDNLDAVTGVQLCNPYVKETISAYLSSMSKLARMKPEELSSEIKVKIRRIQASKEYQKLFKR